MQAMEGKGSCKRSPKYTNIRSVCGFAIVWPVLVFGRVGRQKGCSESFEMLESNERLR